ncbi:MAG: hypothetical protein RID53_29300 [Coleofasciculus sp. B1-GNL1-01]|uniref:hypothetical protein n=1 Tax=Coleofasciculus sp. B1-GNL1-01 TaxID=3068484 RepID=UPI003301B8D7
MMKIYIKNCEVLVIGHWSLVKSGRVYLHLGVTEKIVVKPAPTQFAPSDTPSEVEVFPISPIFPISPLLL